MFLALVLISLNYRIEYSRRILNVTMQLYDKGKEKLNEVGKDREGREGTRKNQQRPFTDPLFSSVKKKDNK